jgi:hypothetical protein
MLERRELRTWQEIADYLRLSIRAVQNYEKNANLPVHRLAGLAKSRVWAYTDELDAWWQPMSAAGHTVDSLFEPNNNAADPPTASTRGGAPSHKAYWWYWMAVSVLYSLQYAEAVILEVAYRFDAFGKKALAVAPVVFCWIFVTFVLALVCGWWRTSRSRSGGLVLSVSVTFVSAAIVQIALSPVLPSYATTQEGREPWSAQAAYLKNVVLYFLPLATVYILLPFHFVLAVRRELRENHREDVMALLFGERRTAAPRGAVYLRVWWLAVGLSVAAFVAVALTQDLFDHLKPNPFKNLFMQLALGRTLLFFAIGLFCLLWYSRTLNDIKRECLASSAAHGM